MIHLTRLMPTPRTDDCSHCNMIGEYLLPLILTNTNCHWSLPIPTAIDPYQYLLPLILANTYCHWSLPITTVIDPCQYLLPLILVNTNYHWSLPIPTAIDPYQYLLPLILTNTYCHWSLPTNIKTESEVSAVGAPGSKVQGSAKLEAKWIF